MTREEFLTTLRGRIAGKLPASEVEAELSYYSAYINSLMASGRTEEEAVEELGDPLLIAKTLGKAATGGYLDSDYQYDGKTIYTDASAKDTVRDDIPHYEDDSRESFGSGFQKTRTSRSSTGSAWTRTREKFRSWFYSDKIQALKSNAKAIAVLVIALAVAIACIVLFFVACFQVGGCIVGGLFPIIIAVILGGLLFSIFRR